ncbi:MAG: response regulator [Candidatus Methylacidiphilales bacterium]|nr:response regulator [Candidatus Methylacidiphilales bacterium]
MPTILAIDDSPTLRKFISKHIGERFPDYTVLLASNGADGIQTALREKPDIILLDYLLPDCKGEEVCLKLAADPAGAVIPIILMSSSTPDITRTEGMFPSIKRSMAKPFSPELLCASVNLVLQGQNEPSSAPEEAATAGSASESFSPENAPTVLMGAPKLQKVSLAARPRPITRPIDISSSQAVKVPEACGPLGAFPWIDVLCYAQSSKLTGVLEVEVTAIRLDFYFRDGAPVLGTTRDTAFYLKDAPVKVAPEQEDMFNELKKEQEASGQPIFSQMKKRGYMSPEDADSMIRDYSGLLMGHCWNAMKGRFQIYRRELPDFAADAPPFSESVEQFALESLRNNGPESLAYFGSETAPGTPAYTVAGYRRVQIITLEPDEASLVAAVAAGGRNIEEIAASIGMEIPQARTLLFRFVKLGVFDYWPDFSAQTQT